MVNKIFSKISGWWGAPVVSSPNNNTQITQLGQGSLGNQNILSNAYQQQHNTFYQQQSLSSQNSLSNSHQVLVEQFIKQSEMRCEEYRKTIDSFDDVVKNILDDIKDNINTPTAYSPYNMPDEYYLKNKIDVGNKIQDNIRRHDYANKLEGIINDDN